MKDVHIKLLPIFSTMMHDEAAHLQRPTYASPAAQDSDYYYFFLMFSKRDMLAALSSNFGREVWRCASSNDDEILYIPFRGLIFQPTLTCFLLCSCCSLHQPQPGEERHQRWR